MSDSSLLSMQFVLRRLLPVTPSVHARVERRRGMTLIELMIAIAIALVLTAIALPSIKGLLKDRKTNQAATIVRSMFESAKVKAIAKGRPVAVAFERLGVGDVESNNTAIRLHFAEVLPPYTGDMRTSQCTLMSASSTFNPGAVSPPYERQHYYMFDQNLNPRGDVNVAAVNLNMNPSLLYFARKGSLIAFGDRDDSFEIVDIFFDTGGTPSTALIVFWNQTLTSTANYKTTSPTTSMPSHSPDDLVGTPHRALTDRKTLPSNGVATKFRIYSPPRRLFTKSVELPKGTCVDLSLSGVGDASGTLIKFESLLKTPFPTYLVFSPNGTASEYWTIDAVNGFTRFPLSGNAYFHIGRTGQVIPPSTLVLDPNVQDPKAAANDYFVQNLQDTSGYWVRISSGSGQVVSASNKFWDITYKQNDIPYMKSQFETAIKYARSGATIGNDLSAR